jgi:hypothetical protein
MYEFDILQTTVARDDASELNSPESPAFEPIWQLPAGAMTARSQDGWELVSASPSVERFTSEHGRLRTRVTMLTVWRRPLNSGSDQ